MPLPFIPEPVESLKKRFPFVLQRVWKLEEISTDRPGLHREYIFDFYDGVRLLISIDNFGDGPQLHISCSFEDNELRHFHDMHADVVNHFKLLDNTYSLTFMGISSGGIPHWFATKLN